MPGPHRRLFLAICLSLLLLPPDGMPATFALSLAEAKELARLQNAELAVLRAEKDRAAGTELRARRAFLPSLSAEANYLRADSPLLDAVPVPELTPSPVIGFRDLGPVDVYASAVQLTQPLVNLDAWHGHAQARHQVAAREFAVSRGLRELGAGVTRAYYAVQTVAERRTAVTAALAAARAALALAEAAREEGLAASVDVYRARAEAASRRAQLAATEGELTAARARLREILGVDPDAVLVLLDPVPRPAPPPAVAVPSGQRDDVRALELGVEAATSGVRRAGASFLPRLNLVARQQWLDDDRLFAGDLDGWVVAVTLRWTPFAGMEQIGARAEAEAARRQALEQLRALRDRAGQELGSARARWDAAFRAWREIGSAVSEARIAAELAEGRYREGVGDMTELLQAQAALASARVERSDARFRAVLAAEIYRLAAGVSGDEESP